MIDYILFDMDNTLYPESSGLGPAMRDRMNAFTADYLKVSPERAHQLRRENLAIYGTTLRWLQKCHGFHDIHRFMDEVHPKNIHAYLGRNPALRQMIQELPVSASVLTNSPPEHAKRILSELGIEDLFDYVFDITFNDYNGKPYESCFKKVLSTVAKETHQVLLVDDVPDYLKPFRDLGGEILLVDETGRHRDSGLPSIREILELPDYLREHQLISFQR